MACNCIASRGNKKSGGISYDMDKGLVVLEAVASRLRREASYANPDESQRDVSDPTGRILEKVFGDLADILQQEIAKEKNDDG